MEIVEHLYYSLKLEIYLFLTHQIAYSSTKHLIKKSYRIIMNLMNV